MIPHSPRLVIAISRRSFGPNEPDLASTRKTDRNASFYNTIHKPDQTCYQMALGLHEQARAGLAISLSLGPRRRLYKGLSGGCQSSSGRFPWRWKSDSSE
ncbi:hypothetical protein E2C01_023019 [Portunus trituberculatus]|uniref:Uncharacterized protein n=1 Tax=Portunus trituberculatus TaxID=210409 RepID=A0A5B7E6W2_PORTR|nr:hypothetical protein [Portunus trituberculatus]